MNTNVNHPARRKIQRLLSGTLAGLVLTVAACGSDEDSSDGTSAPATAAPSPAGDADSSQDTSASGGDEPLDTSSGTLPADTMPTDTAADMPVDSIVEPDDTTPFTFVEGDPIPGLTDVQSQLVNMVMQLAAAEDIEIDTECFIDVVSQLSAEDAQKIMDAGPTGEDPELSPEGEALGEQAEACIPVEDDVDTGTP